MVFFFFKFAFFFFVYLVGFCGFLEEGEWGCEGKLQPVRDIGAVILHGVDIILAVSSLQYPLEVNIFFRPTFKFQSVLAISKYNKKTRTFDKY